MCVFNPSWAPAEARCEFWGSGLSGTQEEQGCGLGWVRTVCCSDSVSLVMEDWIISADPPQTWVEMMFNLWFREGWELYLCVLYVSRIGAVTFLCWFWA